ncbi:MAG: ATP-binding cassette domain-containing protein [Lachnospiraceae bacterium]|nr:ATP-binding cassette domain-containing protein [Lachnospiraceae bacterium]
MAVIQVEHLVKDYKIAKKGKGLKGAVKNLITNEKQVIHAVRDLNFEIEKGEIVAFIGPNGAGKSTTVKMMSGILTPTSGQVLINGKNSQKNRKEVVQDLGVVFGQRSQLNWDLRLGESFELLRHIYQIDKKQYEENLEIMNDILGINEIINTPVRQLSLGQRMRGDLVAAMLHSPSVLFLDEPTIGLDVDGKYAIRKFIKEINQVKGTTVILTTHDLGDIQELCERLIIINHGVLIEDGPLNELIDRIAPYKNLIVEFYDETCVKHPKAELFFHEENIGKYRFMKKDITAAQLIQEISEQIAIKDVTIEEATIDDIIRIAYHKE